MLRSTIGLARRARDYAQLASPLKAAQNRDRREGLGTDPGIAWAVAEGLEWLGRAQDNSALACCALFNLETKYLNMQTPS